MLVFVSDKARKNGIQEIHVSANFKLDIKNNTD